MKKEENKLQVPKKTNKQTRFKKGVSGNSAGRPKRSTSAEELRQQILTGAPDLISHLFAQAKKDDLQAAKLLLERVVPLLKPQSAPVAIALPEGDIASQVQFLLGAASLGQISVETAMDLAHIAQIALSLLDSTSIDLPSEGNPEIENAAYCSHATHPPDATLERSVTVTEIAQHFPEQTPLKEMNPTPEKENLS